ncbi:MAG: CU044_5270 family protein [Kibdelosporangium sp.]
MNEQNVHEVWSDDDLDRALAALHSTVDTDRRRLAAARTELERAAGAVPRPRRGRWAVAVAAVVVLVAGFLAVQIIPFGGRPPAASAASLALTSAADKITAADPPVRPGQYRYIAVHGWVTGTLENFTRLQESHGELWIPADPSQEWLDRGGPTGRYTWLVGNDADATAAGIPPVRAQVSEQRARCGDFYPGPAGRPCAIPGSWQSPKPVWLAELPRDPQRLYDRLAADTSGHGNGESALLDYAADTLRSGLVPADLRTALYRALAKLPGLEITDRSANLDGRTGIAFGMADGRVRHEIIIDPQTGGFIGERRTTIRDADGIKAGTVISHTSVSTAVVGEAGTRPAS